MNSIKDDLHKVKCDVNFHRFSLPLASVVIINYNYGRFLREAVDSVFSQSYPNIECIIVDNASTDDSAGIITELSRQYPSAIVLRRADNAGTIVAAAEGFELSSGEYVVFLDADDVLLSAFIETHIFVHMSLRIPVGATSADMVQAVGTRMVLGTYLSTTSEIMRSEKGKQPGLFRRIDENAPEVWPLHSPDAAIESQIRFVDPLDANWVWAPTSANCFRRDALDLFLDKPSPGDIRVGLDCYLLTGISVLTGSVLIDRALAVYRTHGRNIFTRHPSLNGLAHYDRGTVSDRTKRCREVLIDHLIGNAQLFVSKVNYPEYYLHALEALNNAWPNHHPTASARRKSYLAKKVIAEFDTLADVIGIEKQCAWLRRLGFSRRVDWVVYMTKILKQKSRLRRQLSVRT
jgi:glycosyltransferase involved in cell wall biosynthesis